MKYAFFTLLMIFSIATFAESQKIRATVKGMVCGFCAQGITKKFSSEPAVEKIDVSLKKQLVTVNLKEGQNLTDEKIKTILQDSGYSVEKIERSGK